MGALTKREIAEAVSGELGLSVRVSLDLVDRLFHEVRTALAQGHDIKIVRFGTLAPVQKAGRRGTSPANGEPILIPPRQTVVFRPSRTLKGIVNAGQREEILSDRRGQQADGG